MGCGNDFFGENDGMPSSIHGDAVVYGCPVLIDFEKKGVYSSIKAKGI